MDITDALIRNPNVNDLVSGLVSTNIPDPQPEVDPDAPQMRRPTIPSFVQSMQTGDDNITPQRAYPELMNPALIDAAVDPKTQLAAEFKSLKDKVPAERAMIGGRFGAKVGARTQGLHGAVIGAGIGAVVARSLGILQTGEHEDAKRKESVFGTWKTVGIADDQNKINFDDGGSFDLNLDPSFKLSNIDSLITGEKERPNTAVDVSHPMSKRTMSAVLPLAYYTTQGLLGWSDTKNPRDTKALENTTGLLVNALQSGATSINQVYDRARQMAAKYGNEDTLRTFFNTIKESVPDSDALAIRQGLDVLFPK